MFNNLNSTLKKVTVIFLIMTLTYANFVLIGHHIMQGLISYAVEEGQDNASTNNEDEEEESTDTENEGSSEAIEEDIELLSIENKDIHKTKISEDGEVEYKENLKISLDNITETSNIIIEDILNEFYDKEGSLNEEINLSYKTTKINKQDLLNLLGNEGKLVIKDRKTNAVVIELTKSLIEAQETNKKLEQKFITNEETNEEEVRSNLTVTEETVEIEYVIDITNIKVELTNITIEQNVAEELEENVNEDDENTESEKENLEFIIENTKTISNINDIENLDCLYENINYTINEEEKTLQSTIKFKDTITRADFIVDNTEWVVGEANKVKYTITLDTTTEKSELFVNPMFLLELPSSVESINTANSQFTVNNDNGAFESKKVFITTILGKKYVVITLQGEQTNEKIVNGNTTIDLSLELNIAQTTEGNEETKLYYQNDTVTAYESGKGFDTAEITVTMIMESEPKEEIEEQAISFDISNVPTGVIKQGEEVSYNIYVYNDSTEKQENIQIVNILPEGATVVKVEQIVDETEQTVDYVYNADKKELTINIVSMDGKTEEIVAYDEEGEPTTIIETRGKKEYKVTIINNLAQGVFSKEAKNVVKVQQENEVIDEKEFLYTVSDIFLNIEKEQLAEDIKEGERISLGITITNKGLIEGSDLNIEFNLPEEITVQSYKTILTSSEGEVLSKTEMTLNGNVLKLEGIFIGVNETLQISLTGDVTELNENKEIIIEGKVEDEEISWEIDVLDKEETPDGEKPDGEKPDGEKPDGETPDGEKPDGEKPDGEKPDGETPDGENPDGETPVEGFDLSLKQYLNKVTVTNTQGTTEYNYKDTNFAKVEIHSKHMNGSKIKLEYKIVIKNEGTIPGYARKIVNYIPEGLSFNADLNKGWYLGDDKNLYSVALIEKLLNPGETAELTIILEKEMTKDNVGTITNLVEIYEATNNENVEDINSIPGDKLEGQNDMSKVEVMVVTSTGTIILYITLAIAVISIIGLGFYKVRKIALTKKGGC